MTDLEDAVDAELKAQTSAMFRKAPWGHFHFRSIPLDLWRGMAFAGPPILLLAAIGLL